VLKRGYEGDVAKDEASPYVGSVTGSWLKVKVPEWTRADQAIDDRPATAASHRPEPTQRRVAGGPV
jgi:hypothetical protein